MDQNEQETNAQFYKIESIRDYEMVSIPVHILYNPYLTGNALKLILHILYILDSEITQNKQNSQLNKKELMKLTSLGDLDYSNAMKNLTNLGYVKRKPELITGSRQAYKYEFNEFPYKSEN